MSGIVALTGGSELQDGNEEQDRFLVEHSRGGPAYILATANSKHPDMAVSMAQRWFAGLGKEVVELPVRSRQDANSKDLAARAARGGMFYMVGGNPGRIAEVLRGSLVWESILTAWRAGAALGGSSAGAMVLATSTLVDGRAVDGLDLVHEAAVLPHYNTFGQSWAANARASLGEKTWLLGLDERTALVHHGGWIVMGAGTVTVLRGSSHWTGKSGQHLDLKIRVG